MTLQKKLISREAENPRAAIFVTVTHFAAHCVFFCFVVVFLFCFKTNFCGKRKTQEPYENFLLFFLLFKIKFLGFGRIKSGFRTLDTPFLTA